MCALICSNKVIHVSVELEYVYSLSHTHTAVNGGVVQNILLDDSDTEEEDMKTSLGADLKFAVRKVIKAMDCGMNPLDAVKGNDMSLFVMLTDNEVASELELVSVCGYNVISDC